MILSVPTIAGEGRVGKNSASGRGLAKNSDLGGTPRSLQKLRFLWKGSPSRVPDTNFRPTN